MPLALGRAKSIAAAQEAARSRAADRCAAAARADGRRSRARAAVRGRHRRRHPPLCAPRPTATTTWSARASSAFGCIEFVPGYPFIARSCRAHRGAGRESTPEIEARFLHLKEQALEALQLLPQVPPELDQPCSRRARLRSGADLVASFMDLSRRRSRRSWRRSTCSARLDKVLELLRRPHRGAEALAARSASRRRHAARASQREYFLREQLKAIQKELGEADEHRGRDRRSSRRRSPRPACPKRPRSRRARS